MKVLVTGGAGFIGTNLVKRLLSENHSVISYDNYSTGKKSNHLKGAVYREIDIKNLYDGFLEEFDIVFHMAAIARIQPSFLNPIEYFTTNSNGTINVANGCIKQNIPLIYAGSSSFHSGKFKNPYTFSKTVGEEILRLFGEIYNLKYTVTRFYNVYGPYQLTEGGYTTLIGRWISNIQKGINCEIYGDGEQRRDFTHVYDIIDALIKIMEQKKFGYDFELGRGKNYSVNEVAKMFNIKPDYKGPKPGEAKVTLCNSDQAKIELGWSPSIDLTDYIADLII